MARATKKPKAPVAPAAPSGTLPLAQDGTKLVIRGGRPLRGVVVASGAKNAALPIMAACLLVKGDCVLERVPNISDVWVMKEILIALGARVEFGGQGTMVVNTDGVTRTKAPHELVKKIHASFDITGPLLARFHRAEVSLPGGCVLGTRAVNLHLEGFQALGAQVAMEHGYLTASAQALTGNRCYFPKPSVGATKNVMMAACLAQGQTVLENAAREPEVVDLANFLNRCGARIRGAGTARMVVEGVAGLTCPGGPYRIIPDRIETGTYLVAGAASGGDVTVRGTDPALLQTVLGILEAAGQTITTGADWVRVVGARPVASEISTSSFPGFPTDLQPPVVALLTLAQGTSIIEETIFDGRWNYVDELRRMGADVRVTDRTALIKGVEKLTGAPVDAMDIRAGGALVVAALVAQGQSEIGGVKYIDRGYEDLEAKLSALGADVRRMPANGPRH